MDKNEVLKQYFGHSEFRPGQGDIIDHILAGQDCLGVMPTGVGKSVCFQVPALMFSGTSIVISPLISLMKDQVEGLRQSGVNAAFINSSLDLWEYRQVLDNASSGLYKILYVAPERLTALIAEQIPQLLFKEVAHRATSFRWFFSCCGSGIWGASSSLAGWRITERFWPLMTRVSRVSL